MKQFYAINKLMGFSPKTSKFFSYKQQAKPTSIRPLKNHLKTIDEIFNMLSQKTHGPTTSHAISAKQRT